MHVTNDIMISASKNFVTCCKHSSEIVRTQNPVITSTPTLTKMPYPEPNPTPPQTIVTTQMQSQYTLHLNSQLKPFLLTKTLEPILLSQTLIPLSQ